MDTEALRAKKLDGPRKEQYSKEHLRALGFDEDGVPLPTPPNLVEDPK